MSDSECNSSTDGSVNDNSLSDVEMDMENNDGQYLSDAGNFSRILFWPISVKSLPEHNR